MPPCAPYSFTMTGRSISAPVRNWRGTLSPARVSHWRCSSRLASQSSTALLPKYGIGIFLCSSSDRYATNDPCGTMMILRFSSSGTSAHEIRVLLDRDDFVDEGERTVEALGVGARDHQRREALVVRALEDLQRRVRPQRRDGVELRRIALSQLADRPGTAAPPSSCRHCFLKRRIAKKRFGCSVEDRRRRRSWPCSSSRRQDVRRTIPRDAGDAAACDGDRGRFVAGGDPYLARPGSCVGARISSRCLFGL